MLRAIFMIGLFAMLGLFAVGMVFKLFGGLVGLTFFLVALALKVVIVGGLLYSYSRYHVYWQAGPLEIFSVVTWLLYLVIIQSRINAGWGGRAAALASILSFIIVICSLVGVRYLGHAF